MEMAEGFKLEIYRKEPFEELTKKLSDPAEKAGIGSAAAASAAVAASMLARAAAQIHSSAKDVDAAVTEKLDWFTRNTEILRSYMVKLVDEDVKCHGPLRRALKEGDARKIEASRQAAVSICLEIVNMMGTCLEIAESLCAFADAETAAELCAGSDMAYGASTAAGRYILSMSRQSPDDTYQYVMRRENELTMQTQKETYERILTAAGELCAAL